MCRLSLRRHVLSSQNLSVEDAFSEIEKYETLKRLSAQILTLVLYVFSFSFLVENLEHGYVCS